MNIFKTSDKILIIGGTGFIGRHLAEKCSKVSPCVACLGLDNNSGRVMSAEKAEYLHADISDKAQLKAVLKDKTFDYVFNLGGYIDHTPYFKGGRQPIDVHFAGMLNLLDCLDIKTLKGFVQVGSSDEYGDNPAPQKEAMRERPISPYSLAKAAASHFIQMLSKTEGFPGVVLRFFLVYGPGQDEQRFLPQIIKGCLNNDEFKTSEGNQLRDFCYIDDVIDAMVKAAVFPSSKGHIINIASGRPVSIKEMIHKIVSLTGGGRPIWGALPYRKGENMELYADISLAGSLLNWEPETGIGEGLKKTIEYYMRTNKREAM